LLERQERAGCHHPFAKVFTVWEADTNGCRQFEKGMSENCAVYFL
jgi:hypothetical protein